MNWRTARRVGTTSTGSYRHAPAVASMKTLSLSAGAFYLLGGIGALLPDATQSTRQQLGNRAIGVFDILVGLALLLTGRRWPRAAYHVLVAGGALLIATAMVLSKGSASAEDPIIVFTLPIVAGAAYFAWRGAAVHTAIVVAAAFAAMAYAGIRHSEIIIVLGALVCIGTFVAWLTRLADRVEEDPLTQLGNRRALMRQLETAVERAERTGDGFAVVMLDLDHFKAINDSAGHAAGDELLRACAARWRDLVPDERLIFRYGGDEFALILPSCSLGDATELAERLRGGLPSGTTTSVGAAVWAPGDSSSLLMGRADVALYEAKANGRDQTVAYGDPSQSAREIEAALRAGEFVLHYQPIVALGDGTVRGYESLVRWQHPTRGLLGPGEFVSQAERTGSIHALGAWTLDEACATAVRGPADRAMAVNVSIAELRNPSYVALVQKAIERHRLVPRRLIVEVTEGVYDQDDRQVTTSLTQLRELGVRVALDDFGSGWSSLRWLTTFPVDIVKIDGSFVHGIDQDVSNIEVINAVIRLGKALGLNVVGEQVETEHQARVLRDLGCDRAQGYFFGRPGPIDPAGDDVAAS